MCDDIIAVSWYYILSPYALQICIFSCILVLVISLLHSENPLLVLPSTRLKRGTSIFKRIRDLILSVAVWKIEDDEKVLSRKVKMWFVGVVGLGEDIETAKKILRNQQLLGSIRFEGITYSVACVNWTWIEEKAGFVGRMTACGGGCGMLGKKKEKKYLEIRRIEERKMVKLISRIKGIISCRRFSSDLSIWFPRLLERIRRTSRAVERDKEPVRGSSQQEWKSEDGLRNFLFLQYASVWAFVSVYILLPLLFSVYFLSVSLVVIVNCTPRSKWRKKKKNRR